jgi:hypothetical protein
MRSFASGDTGSAKTKYIIFYFFYFFYFIFNQCKLCELFDEVLRLRRHWGSRAKTKYILFYFVYFVYFFYFFYSIIFYFINVSSANFLMVSPQETLGVPCKNEVHFYIYLLLLFFFYFFSFFIFNQCKLCELSDEVLRLRGHRGLLGDAANSRHLREFVHTKTL